MKALLIGAAFNNATDGNINRGIINIFKLKYPNFRYDYVFINDHVLMKEEDFNSTLLYDVIVICGTPWLWDQFQSSYKYKNFLIAKKSHPHCDIILMGIGSCLYINDINSDILRRKLDQEHLEELTKNATIIVRDNLAHDILNYHNISSNLLPCPSYWAHINDMSYSPSKVFPAMIWYDPRYGISGGDWQGKDKYDAYCKLFANYNTKYSPLVYCTDQRDIPGALAIGLPSPILLTTSEDSRNAVRFASHVLSGRVHCAIPAKAMAIPTYLIPVDSRARTMYDFEKINNIDKFLEKYFELI